MNITINYEASWNATVNLAPNYKANPDKIKTAMNLSQLSEIKSYLRKVDNSGYFVILQYCHGVVGKAVLQI